MEKDINYDDFLEKMNKALGSKDNQSEILKMEVNNDMLLKNKIN